MRCCSAVYCAGACSTSLLFSESECLTRAESACFTSSRKSILPQEFYGLQSHERFNRMCVCSTGARDRHGVMG